MVEASSDVSEPEEPKPVTDLKSSIQGQSKTPKVANDNSLDPDEVAVTQKPPEI